MSRGTAFALSTGLTATLAGIYMLLFASPQMLRIPIAIFGLTLGPVLVLLALTHAYIKRSRRQNLLGSGGGGFGIGADGAGCEGGGGCDGGGGGGGGD
jgi:hypothetical protein